MHRSVFVLSISERMVVEVKKRKDRHPNKEWKEMVAMTMFSTLLVKNAKKKTNTDKEKIVIFI